MSCTNGRWNVREYSFALRSHDFISVFCLAVGRVALDTRLGCVSKEGNEESKRIIDAINTFFWTVAEVELRMPVWRFYKTKAYKKYIGALDSFTEYVFDRMTASGILVEQVLYDLHIFQTVYEAHQYCHGEDGKIFDCEK